MSCTRASESISRRKMPARLIMSSNSTGVNRNSKCPKESFDQIGVGLRRSICMHDVTYCIGGVKR